MLSLLVLAALPEVIQLPPGGLCPDAVFLAGRAAIVYGKGNDAFLRIGSSVQRINSEVGTVVAGGERGPKVSLGGGLLCAVWQGDYRQGAKVWFARRRTEDEKFEAQRNLLDGPTPGIDHPGIASRGNTIMVFWLDGRGGPDPKAPVTSTIWYSISVDGGKSFSGNRPVKAPGPVRACACCSMAGAFEGSDVHLVYRGGIDNERDIWSLHGDPLTNRWTNTRVTQSHWVFEGCPMDGPRLDGDRIVYSLDAKCYIKSESGQPELLGAGKYPGIAGGFATWQDAGSIRWRSLTGSQTGVISTGGGRCVTTGLAEQTVIIR